MELKGKRAVVTGVSKGIGKAIVLALLEKGVKVAGWSRNDPRIDHPDFKFYPTNIRDFEKVAVSFKKTIDELGRIDILVNNAGLGVFAKIEEQSMDDWHQMFDTNVHGLFYATKLIVPIMKEKQSGHIINIASIAGTTGIPEAAGYCGTKHAVRGISQSLFKELRKDNIKVSCMYPGSVNTDFFNEIEDVTANDTMLHPGDIAKMVIHILETPDNFLTVDVEVRPMNPKYS